MFESFKLNRKIRSELQKSRARLDEIRRFPNLGHAGLEELISKRRSKTLYIFGSGSSVCELDFRQWEQVSKSDSLGINFWIIHCHIPSYYIFEIPKISENRDIFMYCLRTRLPEYQAAGTSVLMKPEAAVDIDFLAETSSIAEAADIKVGIPCYFTVSNIKQFRLLLENYEDITRPLREKYADAYFRKRASVVFAVMLGYEIGFSNIVLCGIDGTAGSGYFYQFPDAGCLADNIKIPGSSGQSDGQIHKTMDSSRGEMTADMCLRMINDHLFRRKGIRMWVGTSNSMLSDWMPSWPWSA